MVLKLVKGRNLALLNLRSRCINSCQRSQMLLVRKFTEVASTSGTNIVTSNPFNAFTVVGTKDMHTKTSSYKPSMTCNHNGTYNYQT